MTTLSDLRLAAQQRCDLVGNPWPTTEWNGYVNHSIGELFGLLTSTYEDFHLKTFQFTLSGGFGPGNNQLLLGTGTQVPDFHKLRALGRQGMGNGSTNQFWVPVPKVASYGDKGLFQTPPLNPYWGTLAVQYSLYGNILEIVPSQAAGNTYLLSYTPAAPTLINDTDAIDSFWLGTNGWDEYVTLDVAIKALVKIEQIDSAGFLAQQKQALANRILTEAANRDDNEPGYIRDVKSTRSGWGFGGGGIGNGWGGF